MITEVTQGGQQRPRKKLIYNFKAKWNNVMKALKKSPDSINTYTLAY